MAVGRIAMSFITDPPPPKVKQERDVWCWAAALESWVSAVGVDKTITQSRIVELFGDRSGYLDIKRFKEVSKRFYMDYRIISRFPSTSEMELTLKKFKYIYLAYKQKSGVVGGIRDFWWHCVVLYGVEKPINSDASYLVMDPYNEPGKSWEPYIKDPTSEFFQLGDDSEVYFSWLMVPMVPMQRR
jgi:hypothetical protein